MARFIAYSRRGEGDGTWSVVVAYRDSDSDHYLDLVAGRPELNYRRLQNGEGVFPIEMGSRCLVEGGF
ncbi:MAG: hypothetical protein IT539_13065 [Bradyrhizobiaceae bacterium]|nr:hypothetical protein [Bradyrhizobiaceae bacterium]